MGNANWMFIIVKIMISVLLVVIMKMKYENDVGWKSDFFSFSTGWRLGKAFSSLLKIGYSGGQPQSQGKVCKLGLPWCLGTPRLPNPRQLILFQMKKVGNVMSLKDNVSKNLPSILVCCFMVKSSVKVLSHQSMFLPPWWEEMTGIDCLY